ncbi:MAG: ABC transporter permease subunit [Clostridia bacterium]|jgi:alpha-glucoside transport system permease protein|nr:ABC transporter permease subunit [Clostridia bacterium]
MSEKTSRVLSRGLLHTVVILIAVLWLIPTIGVLITSFRPAQDIANSGWWTVLGSIFDSARLTLRNYNVVLSRLGVGRAFLNSFIITIPATIIPLSIALLAAYALGWMKFFGRTFVFMALIALLVVPLQMTFIPVLRIFNKSGLAGSFPGIWLAHSGYGLPLAIYMLYNSISGLPEELFDSASIDGASSFHTFLHIVLPLSVPIIASLAIFQFLWVWNDLLVALIYLGGTPDVAPITVQISSLVGSYGQDWELLTAAVFISIIPSLIIFFSLQRYFVRGILAGSVKG